MKEDAFISTMMPLVQKNRSHMDLVFRFAEMAPKLKLTIASSFMRVLADELRKIYSDWLIDN
jgi:hypothetical protein